MERKIQLHRKLEDFLTRQLSQNISECQLHSLHRKKEMPEHVNESAKIRT